MKEETEQPDLNSNESLSDDDSSQDDNTPPVTLLVDAPPKTKWGGFLTRASWSLVMIFSFLFIIVYLQQNGCVVLVFLVQAVMYSELTEIGRNHAREAFWPLFRLLYWYWFAVFQFLLYGKSLEKHFLMHSLKHKFGFKVSKHLQSYQLYAFGLYLLGLVIFVFSLHKKHLRYQFQRFAQCHVILLVVILQSAAIISNIFSGLFWFLFPCSLVIANDIWAYIFGFLFGRTPLISLSPKKTWEGFIGGSVATLFFGTLMAKLLVKFPLMVCPRLGFKLEYWPKCDTELISKSITGVDIAVLVSFASLIAPFGGFFASGFKRAFKVKDFGQSIPGHGGITDRMDCQILMGAFVFVYLSMKAANSDELQADEQQILTLINYMNSADKLRLFNMLKGTAGA